MTDPEPASGVDPDPDDFIDDEVRFAVSTTLSDGPIGKRATEGPLLGRLTNKTSQLFSALAKGGADVPRAVEAVPVYFRQIVHKASVDFDFELAPEERLTEGGLEGVFGRFGSLLDSAPTELAATASGLGGAVAYTYAQLTKVLGSHGINAEFRGDSVRSLVLPWELAETHSAILEHEVPLERKVVRLFGALDELKDSKGTFLLKKPKDGLDKGSETLWSSLVNRAQSMSGELTPDAVDDIHRLNAWGKPIVAVVEVTQMSTPSRPGKIQVDARLIQVEYSQEKLR